GVAAEARRVAPTRRKLGALVASALGGTALAACGVPVPGAPPAARSKEPFTLEVIQSFNPQTEGWFKDTFVPQYQARVGGHVSVNHSWVAWEEMEEKFVTHKLAGSLADVLRTGAGPWVWVYANKQIGMPIDEHIRRDGKGLKEDFFPAAWETLVWEGKTYGFVTTSGPRMYTYRQDIADSVGVKIADTWTWENYMDAAVRMNVIENGRLVRLGASPITRNWQEFMLIFYAGGGRVTKNGRAAFNTPEGEWALDLILQRKNRLQPAGTEGLPTVGGGTSPFAEGRIGIIYGNLSAARPVEQYAPQHVKDIVVPQPPLKAKRVSMVNSDGLTINRDTKHPDEAWEFLKLSVDRGPLEAWCGALNQTPPRKSVAADAGFMKAPYMQKAASNLDKYGVPVPVWPDYTNLFTNMEQGIDAAFASQKSARQALADSALYWNNVLEQHKWKD
ncbi:MAG: extracellular solute-binding protein, partial [Chloroflexota bacterium]|nr:extracellular solute-binding protein [Chloroflexota bacterium]